MLPLHGNKGGHYGADAELRNIAAEDAGEQRRGDAGQHLGAEVATHKAGHGFVCNRGVLAQLIGACGLAGVRGAGFSAEQFAVFQRSKVFRNHQAHAVG